jgi:hypothetical protein
MSIPSLLKNVGKVLADFAGNSFSTLLSICGTQKVDPLMTLHQKYREK